MKINKKVLSKYNDEQLAQWAKDNKLSPSEVDAVKVQLGSVDATKEEKQQAGEKVSGIESKPVKPSKN